MAREESRKKSHRTGENLKMNSKSYKARFGAAVAGALMLGASFSANAGSIELVFVVDGSASITPTEWTTQVKGYSSAITALVPTNGEISLSVVRFADTAVVEMAMTTIDSVAARDAVANLFWDGVTEMSQSGLGNLTCISCGIELAEGTFSGTATKSIIDVSTDGYWNVGVDPNGVPGNTGTAEWAVANDADVVNAIGIAIVPDFAHGPGSFAIVALDFGDFEAALRIKIATEIGVDPDPECDEETTCNPNEIPEPGTLALFGLGLVGLGFARRRKIT